MHNRCPAIYMMSNKRNGTIYVGVTSNLLQRVYQHKQSKIDGFTKQYHCHYLVFYEYFDSMISAIEREKQIKAGNRRAKIKLIESMNPEWLDLYGQLF